MLPPGPPASRRHYDLARWIRRPMDVLEEYRARYGETFLLDLGVRGTNIVVTGDPELVRDVFSGGPEEMHAGEANAVLRPFLGEHSLLLLDGKEHIRQRKLLLPPFHGERMQAYGQAMIDATHAVIDSWPVGQPFSLAKSMREVTLEIILKTVFGLDDARRDPMFHELSETLDAITSPFMLLPWVQKDVWFLPWSRFVSRARKVDELLHSRIRARRETGTEGRNDVLSLLLDARDEEGRALDDAELRDQLITLLVAGHETTATALAWTFRYVLELRDVEAKLRAEVGEGPFSPESIAQLPYLDATVREALRIRPVIPMVGRRLLTPRSFGPWHFPKGTFVAPSIWLAHHREQVFENPERFSPERFLAKKPGANEWFPFGGGIRRCIGMAFALYEMKMTLATIVQRARLSLAPGASVAIVRRSITLTPAGGLKVVLRDRWKSPDVRIPEPS